MMHLPVFSNPDPSRDYLLKEQDRLQKQARKMLGETKVLEVFKKHGEVGEIGGSYKYGLMIYPDLCSG